MGNTQKILSAVDAVANTLLEKCGGPGSGVPGPCPKPGGRGGGGGKKPPKKPPKKPSRKPATKPEAKPGAKPKPANKKPPRTIQQAAQALSAHGIQLLGAVPWKPGKPTTYRVRDRDGKDRVMTVPEIHAIAAKKPPGKKPAKKKPKPGKKPAKKPSEGSLEERAANIMAGENRMVKKRKQALKKAEKQGFKKEGLDPWSDEQKAIEFLDHKTIQKAAKKASRKSPKSSADPDHQVQVLAKITKRKGVMEADLSSKESKAAVKEVRAKKSPREKVAAALKYAANASLASTWKDFKGAAVEAHKNTVTKFVKEPREKTLQATNTVLKRLWPPESLAARILSAAVQEIKK